jgi:hypothetical protein
VASIVVPVIVGILVLMDNPVVGEVITGAAGTTVSILKLTPALTGEIFPATSVAVAVMMCVPSAIALVNVKENIPFAVVIVVPTETLSI